MIPDFPEEKKKLIQFWNNYLVAKRDQLLGFIGELPSHFNHEGNRWLINGIDGFTDDVEYQEIHGEFVIDLNEVPEYTPDKIRQKIDQAAEELTKQMTRSFFQKINEVTERVGNTVDAKGKPLNQESLLQFLERLDLPFDQDGNLIPPYIIMHPSLWEAKKDEFKEWESDVTFKVKYEEIIKRKREAWNVREARRKLVD